MPTITHTGSFSLSFKNEHTIYENEVRCIVQNNGTLVESIRINAKVTGFGSLEIEIVAMYYFIFLNNGAFLWNGWASLM